MTGGAMTGGATTGGATTGGATTGPAEKPAGGALAGIRVLDMSESIAGQFCCRMLADYGAEVLLVEPIEGSALRRKGPFFPQDGEAAAESVLFYHLNIGKGSVAFDRASPEGRRQLHDLVGRSDVVVVPAFTDRTGLRSANPHAIVSVVSAFGEGTPMSHWRGSEMIYQAMSGMMTNNGRAGVGPLYGVGDRASYCAGISAYVSILAALMVRERTGVAQEVATDIVHTAASMTYPFTLQYSYNGSFEDRGKRNTPLLEVRCADGWISIWIRAFHFPIICEVLGSPELLEDPRFLDDNLRQDNLHELVAEVQKRVAHRKGAEVVDELSARRVVAACSFRPSQLGPDAPHLKARDFWTPVEGGRAPALGPQFRMSRTPRGPLKAPPRIGEGAREAADA